MQYFKPGSVITLLLYLYLGVCCPACKTKPKEPALVKKEIKKDIINCRYTEQMPMGDNDSTAAPVKSSKPK